jgi:pimeloyl-ACP methyl ester carboxylesterase
MTIYKSEAGRQAVEQLYRDTLRRWPAANRQVTVPTRHGDTFVVVSGEATDTPLVLLHGSGTNSSMWMHDVAEWATAFRVYAVDVIGEPGLSAPSRPSLRSDAFAEWLDDVWNGLGLTAAAVVGVSLGGWLALEYAVKRPQRVASLSLLSPSGVGSQNRLFLLKAAVLLLLGEWGLRRAMQLATGRASLPREIAEPLLWRFRHFRPRMEPLPIRSDAELAGLTMPVQVILGARDALIRSSETRDRIRRHVPHATVIYLEEAGHILPRQTGEVGRFLTDRRVRL